MIISISNLTKLSFSILLILISYHYFSNGTRILSSIINAKTEYKIHLSKKSSLNISNKNLEKKNIVDEKIFKKEISDSKSIVEKPIIIKEISDSKSIVEKPIIIEEQNIIKEQNIDIYKQINNIKVKKNENYSVVLKNQKLNRKEITEIINVTSKYLNLKKLSIGQKIYFYYLENENKDIILQKIIIPISFKEEIIIEKINNKFVSKKINLPITTNNNSQKIIIKESIFVDGGKRNIPTTILMDFIRLYSFDVDFQRDIQVNDEFSLMYEVFYNEQGREVAYGDILYSNLVLRGTNYEYFLFNDKDGLSYFNNEGKNVRKSLLKTPLDGARISSSFGLRKHPILGYKKQHRGVDFAAPKGTPIYAAGNGVIEYIGNNGAYGKYVRIRHNNSYKTSYSHLRNYNKKLSKGSRVIQGNVIGYVGSTGRSTGSHLHYEVILNGKKINPMKMKLPPNKTLKDQELEDFLDKSKKLYLKFLNTLDGDFE